MKEIGESLLYTLRPRSAYIILFFFCLSDLKSRRSSDGQDGLSGWPLLAGILSTIRYATKDSMYLITLRRSCGLDGHGLALIKTVRGSIILARDTLKSESQGDGMIPVIIHSNEGYV
jgi:hypothetical protein